MMVKNGLKPKFNQIKGKLDLMKWYNDGKKWLKGKPKFNQIKGNVGSGETGTMVRTGLKEQKNSKLKVR